MSAEDRIASSLIIGPSLPIPLHRHKAKPQDDHDRLAVDPPLSLVGHAPPAVGLRRTEALFDADDALPENDFLVHLRREKRRAERSRAPLSMVLYRVDAPAGGDLDALLEVLYAAKRETDILGHVGDGLLAVLCPDTNGAGVKAFMSKIDERATGNSYASFAATYPDHLFESLAEGRSAVPEDLPPSFMADSPGEGRPEYALKRPFDIAASLILLVLLSPLLLLVALIVATTSRGPVIFKQTRLGKGGVPFVFYKFRSMVPNGDDRIHRDFVAELIKKEQAPAAANAREGENGSGSNVYKIKFDPRITPFGRFIRKTSIDELPQLFNVLIGNMSLVGPRPPIPYEAADYQAWHLRRVLSVKPGITGLWQVNGRSRVTFNEMVRMDLRYIRECSPLTDLKILLKTVLVVLRCDGAR